jgi:hypothetical protein
MKKHVSKLFNRANAFGTKKPLLGVLFALVLSAFTIGVCSCKAWRTISTSATYVQQNDTSKTTTTIQTKTVEEYTGVKK